MKIILGPLCAALLASAAMADIDRQTLDKIHHQNIKLSRQDLVVSVHGYPVPTYGAFHGWLIINGVEGRYAELIQFFTDRGVEHVIPNYLAMLQGTSWAMKGTALFTFPDDRQWKNMANTLEYLQREVVPVIGDVIPVSGDRTEEYNRLSGGAGQSKHLQFCALDLVPVKSYSREELMSKLRAVHRKVGKQYNAGLGIYSGVRFHIDTCGFRQW